MAENLMLELDKLTPEERDALSALLLLQYPLCFQQISTGLIQDVEEEDEEEDDEDEEEEEEEEEEDEEDEEEEEEESRSEAELEVKIYSQINKKQRKKRKIVEIDDSEETLSCMLEWNANTPENPPRKIFVRDPEAMGECSRPIRKQLMESDIKKDQNRLMLGKDAVKKMMVDVMREEDKSGITNGLKVSVYGPDGKIHEMEFKMWGKVRKDTPVLTSSGRNEFVKRYELKAYQSFLTIWMFRHKETKQICFAIDSNLFPVKAKLSKRILNAAF